MSSTRRVTLSLPAHLVADLNDVSRRLGCTRSAALVGVLENALPPLRALLDALPAEDIRPEGVTEGAGRRLRGASGAVLRDQLSGIQDLLSSVPGSEEFELVSDEPQERG